MKKKSKEKYNQPLSVKIGTALKFWQPKKEEKQCVMSMTATKNTNAD